MRNRRTFFAVALVSFLAACTDAPLEPSPSIAAPEGQPVRAMNASSARVVAYLPEWYSGSLDSIPYSKLTHVIYAFSEPDAAGELTVVPESGNTRLQSVVQKAHAAGAKVLISVGGGSGSAYYPTMAASSTARSNFVGNLVSMVGNYGLDGVDIDWEFPKTTTDSTSFVALMTELDTAMHNRGKLLTAAVAADGWYGKWISSRVFPKVDFLTLMAYDDTTSTTVYAHAVASLDYWRDQRQLPQSRTVLGVQFYANHDTADAKPYRTVVAGDAQAPYKDESGGWYYNGLATMKQKTSLSLQRASGVGIWHIAQDTTAAGISLLGAIHDAMNTSKVLYDDARTTGWENWSWSTTVNYSTTSPVYLGSKSIAATYTAAWGGLYLHHATGVSLAGNTKLEFYVHGGTAGGQNLIVQLGDTGGWQTMVSVNSYIAGGSVAAGTWRKVSMPLTALGATSNALTDLVISDNSGGAQPTVYIDQIQFVP